MSKLFEYIITPLNILILFFIMIFIAIYQHNIAFLYLLLVIPLVFVIRFIKNGSKNNNEYSFENEKKLSDQQIDRIRSSLSITQYDFLSDVLLPSLRIMHQSLSEIELGKDAHQIAVTLFDKKFDDVCRAFSRLSSISGMYSTEQGTKVRDLAITAFTFYRVLYLGVTEAIYSSKSKRHFSEQDPYILLKRIPAKLSLYLGAQYWRLYEFKEIVYGDLQKLSLNKDISDIVMQGCYEKVDDKNESDSNDSTSEIQIKKLDEEVENNTEKLQESKTTEERINDLSSQIQTQIKASDIKIELVEKNIEINIAEKFLDWLKQKVNSQDKRYSPNAGEYVFSESLRYGENVLFISEILLDKYYSIRKHSPESVILALKKENYIISSEEKKYHVNKNNVVISLIRLDSINFTHTSTQTVTIEEVPL